MLCTLVAWGQFLLTVRLLSIRLLLTIRRLLPIRLLLSICRRLSVRGSGVLVVVVIRSSTTCGRATRTCFLFSL